MEKQRVRLISIAVMLPMMIAPVYLNGPRYLYLYATQWSIELATLSVVLAFLHGYWPENNLIRRGADVTLGTAICLAFGTMVGFWSAFARVYFPVISIGWVIALSISHIVPQTILLMEWRRSEKDPLWWHGLIGGGIALIYVVIDWYRVVILEINTTYEFLSWESIDSYWKSAAFVFGSVLLYLLMLRGRRLMNPSPK
ncbi:MAG: hypothetical protein CL981_04395 [Euryarchaeota archaeon]|jgi:hypothetical protein|nr:hypothetical protein [Euryarchaeota archaeon]